ncbi:septum formation initiator family protein, partial [Microvirga sp. 3-52]|nr:septum formation initiator family protein [Microvirga sp. 3-52]
DEQEMLMNQLAKLEDDEYIAKLARQEYFLSDDNEIIFSMPNKKVEDKKKTDEKE